MDQLLINVLNGVSAGLLLFMLSSGLTLIFSMMGVLNFAHASFYMLGAYFAYSLSRAVGFWPALVLAPLLVGAMGAFFERTALRRVHAAGWAGRRVPDRVRCAPCQWVSVDRASRGANSNRPCSSNTKTCAGLRCSMIGAPRVN